MAKMKFLCDAERCIECNGCVTACKNEHEVPWGVNRRRVITLGDGEAGEKSISVACMHCTDAPCAAVCPVDCFYTTGQTAWSCMTRTCVSAAAIVFTPVLWAHRNIRRQMPLAYVAKWTNARFVQAVLKTITVSLKLKNTVATVWRKESCLCVRKCVRPKPAGR